MKFCRTIILILLLMNLAGNLYAQQNLVPNGSFEDMTACPQGEDEVYKCVGWRKPTAATTDYASACAPYNNGVNVPNYFTGYHFAYEGVSFMGIGTYFTSATNVCEYIQCKLNTALQSFHEYRVIFYITLSSYSSITTGQCFGAFISQNQLSAPTSYSSFTNTPQILAPAFLTDTSDWTQVSG